MPDDVFLIGGVNILAERTDDVLPRWLSAMEDYRHAAERAKHVGNVYEEVGVIRPEDWEKL